ncbi:MAG TPA: hypothetical protein PKD67_07575 [Ignavibacteriaceae bacterium]|nr:hypothetical protein [Ignavibacteriaceae bacterium]
MNSLFKFLSILLLLFFISCRQEIKKNNPTLNGPELKHLIEETLQGDENSSNKLSGLFTFVADDFTAYNKIILDSIKINKKTFYSVLIENQNPIYNLFAVMDENFNLLLKDESLNGYLNSNWKKSGAKILAVVNESFRSKDIINLERVSYYSIDSLAGDLVFRQFTKIKMPQKELAQNVIFISDTTITTEIVSIFPSSKPVKDVFRFDVFKNQYVSKQNKFNNLVLSEIDSLNIISQEPQIIDYESIRKLLGEVQDSIKIDSTFMITDNDFEIKLDNQWKKLGNYTISSILKKEVKGIKFINPKIGVAISIFKIAAADSTEDYFDKALISQSKDNIKKRVSEEFEDTKNKYQLYEFSCNSKKLILILEAPKSTYENYRDIYNNIFKSFKIKC